MRYSLNDRPDAMTIARIHRGIGSLAVLWMAVGVAAAQTVPANSNFQQTVQRQQVSDQLQKSQQQAQQRQNVADMARQPLAQGSDARHQQQQADAAQRQRDDAQQQDAVSRYRDTSTQGHP